MSKKGKIYRFSYDDAKAVFSVTDKFTKEMAQSFLDYWTFDSGYDEDDNPITQAMIKVAMICIQLAGCEDLNTIGVISHVKKLEGMFNLDGTIGVLLLEVEENSLNEDLLTLKIE